MIHVAGLLILGLVHVAWGADKGVVCLDPAVVIDDIANNRPVTDPVPAMNSTQVIAEANKEHLHYVVSHVDETDPDGRLLSLDLKPGKSWYDPGNIFSGSPRAVPDLMGDRAAAYLGFQLRAGGSRTLPSGKFLGSRVDRYNDSAPRGNKFSLSFYTPRKPRVSNLEYNRVYARDGRLPVGETGAEAVHDGNQHLPGALLPVEVISDHRKKVRSVLDFMDSILVRKDIAPTDRARIMASFDDLLGKVAYEVDSGTAELANQMWTYFSRAEQNRTAARFLRFNVEAGTLPGQKLFVGDISPAIYMRNLISHQDPDLRELLEYYIRQNPELNQIGLPGWNLERVRTELNRRLRDIPRGLEAMGDS